MSLSWGENIIFGLPFGLGGGTGHPGGVPKRKMRGKSAQADGGMRCEWGAAHRIP